MTEESMERFIAAAERMQLAAYVRYQTDTRRRMRDAFVEGLMRGLGIMVGFSVLGAAAPLLLEEIARRSLPGISGFVAQVVHLVQLRLQ